ncbi:MAG: histidine phosphatase family protein [Rhodobacteraceae bacterium]|nr:histidine phosphatase family protein [Paracoccaceae bacterium]
MAEIILVRHGQAQTGATDEASYDSLSPVGKQQAAWLGDWMRATNGHFDRVVTGTLVRQKTTAEAMGFGDNRVEDAGWNEVDYFSLAAALERQHGVPFPTNRDSFVDHLPKVFSAWAEDTLGDVPESYQAYLDRVEGALARLAEGGGRVLAVTSSGVLGGLMTRVLNLNVAAQTRLMLQIQNTSVHRLEIIQGQTYVAEFGTTPHLASNDRANHRTFI